MREPEMVGYAPEAVARLRRGRPVTGRRRSGLVRGMTSVFAAASAVLASVVVASPATATSHTISTFAGAGDCDTATGEDGCQQFADGPKADAFFHGPANPVFNGSGDMFLADQQNHRIRKVASGSVSTVVGDPECSVYVAVSDPGPPETWTDDTTRCAAYQGGFAGDGGTAASAKLNSPAAVILDGSNLVIADSRNHRVRYANVGDTTCTAASPCTHFGVSFTANNIIKTIAGTGTAGFSGDSGPGTSANLNGPYGLARDGSGNLYVADHFNGRVRKLATSGIIFTVAGTGTVGFSGDGGAATSAQLSSPVGVAVDGAKLFVTDQNNSNVRLVNLNTSGNVTAATKTVGPGNIATVAGSAGKAGFLGDGGDAWAAELSRPFATTVNPATGDLYIADEGNQRVRKVLNSTGKISTYAGRTVDQNDDDYDDTRLVLPPLGPLPYCPSSAERDAYYSPANSAQRLVWGPVAPPTNPCPGGYDGDGGDPTDARLGNPRGVAINGSSLYIAEARNNRVRVVNAL